MLTAINEAVSYIQKRIDRTPEVAIILGSGLGKSVDHLKVEEAIDYASIPHFPVSTVEGHEGKLISGQLGEVAVLVKQGVFSKDEVRSRVHVRMERYLMDLDIEYHTMLELVDAAVLPAASGYLGELAASVAAAKQAGLTASHLGRAEYLSGLVTRLCEARDALCKVKVSVDGEEDEAQQASRYAYELMPALDELRGAADAIEAICSDRWWSLPRYAEMLFVR